MMQNKCILINKVKRPSQNELRWPLSFYIRLKSFGFSSKSLQVSSYRFHGFKPFCSVRSLLRGYFCKIMRYGQQAKFNFHLFQPTEMEPLEVLVVLEVSKYGFHILWPLAPVFKTFRRKEFLTFPFLDCKHSVNHVFLSPTSIINFTSKKQSYDDTRRSSRDNELLQRAQSDL